MGRKSKIQKELEERQKELNEILKAEEESRVVVKAGIDELIKDKFFCGVALGMEDILAILKLYMTSKEPVKVEYQLYSIEENDDGSV